MIKVLVVEDEEMIRKGIVLTVNWESLDCTVAGEASNGLEALDAVSRLSPDLIITDIKMPQMDGIEMLRKLRETGNNTHVIILSAYDTFSYVQSALRLGAVDYLLKPFHDGDLEHAIKLAHGKICPDSPSSAQKTILNIKEGSKSKFIREAMDYISMHYNDPDISISSIAEYLSISEGYLSRTFKKETGLSPLTYLTQYRIQQSMLMLSDCRIKVYEVAQKVGYQDIAYFSNTFKKLVGMSPSEYQNTQSRVVEPAP